MFDFGVGYSELFVLALIAIVVIGPKDLPHVLRTFGRFMAKARGMAREFQGHVDTAMKDSGLDELKKEAQGLKSSLSAPAMMSGAVASAKSNPGYETYFGTSPEAGETRIAGELQGQDAAPNS